MYCEEGGPACPPPPRTSTHWALRCAVCRYSAGLPNGDKEQFPPVHYVLAFAAYLQTLPRFTRRSGADWVIVQTHPGQYSYHQEWFRPSLHVTGERQQLVESDRAGSVERGTVVVVPYVGLEELEMATPVAGSPRPALLFYAGACSFAHAAFGPDWRLHFSSGKMLRKFVTVGLRALGKGAKVNVQCAGANLPGAPTHEESMHGMRSAVFCPVIAGDTQVGCALRGAAAGRRRRRPGRVRPQGLPRPWRAVVAAADGSHPERLPPRLLRPPLP